MSMMSTSDWPNVDTNNVVPHLVSSGDLFDGELFGDELIDIYNSTVHEGDHEIPSLMVPSEHPGDENHPGAQVAVTAAAIDDGLGAFRHSNSFSDLTNLLSSTGEHIEAATSAPAIPAAAAFAPAPAAVSTAASIITTNDHNNTTYVVPIAAAPMVLGQAHVPLQPAPAPVSAASSKKRRISGDDASASPSKKSSGPKGVRKPSIKQESDLNKIIGATPDGNQCNDMAMDSEQVPQTPIPVAPSPQVSPSPPSRSVSHGELVSQSPTSSICSDSDFKSIAQAAVSSLINTACKSDSSVMSDGRVDTSTEHIKALTGNNWVAACSGANVGVQVVPPASDSKSNNRARRQNLTPDERARQNRDRNREHARNTRLRKKAYVEELKRTLTELVSQRDAADFEKRQSAQRELEQREVRFRVIEEFLKLQGRNERNFSRWAGILEDGFVMTIPNTPFRKMVGAGDKFEKVLDGVANVMTDTEYFHDFLQTLGSNAGELVSLNYRCDRKTFFMDGACAILEFEAVSQGATKRGMDGELSFKGVLRGTFSPASNKLLSASITYDSGLIIAQLRKTNGLSREMTDEAAAAAANTADALLDSLQITVPCAVTVIPPSSDSATAGDKVD